MATENFKICAAPFSIYFLMGFFFMVPYTLAVEVVELDLLRTDDVLGLTPPSPTGFNAFSSIFCITDSLLITAGASLVFEEEILAPVLPNEPADPVLDRVVWFLAVMEDVEAVLDLVELSTMAFFFEDTTAGVVEDALAFA